MKSAIAPLIVREFRTLAKESCKNSAIFYTGIIYGLLSAAANTGEIDTKTYLRLTDRATMIREKIFFPAESVPA